MAMRQVRVKTVGSAIAASYQMTSGVSSEKRSVILRASLWKVPARSSHVLSLNESTLTTSVSPSQWPTEWPIQVSDGGSSTLSRWIVRAAFVNAYDISTLLVLCVISNG